MVIVAKDVANQNGFDEMSRKILGCRKIDGHGEQCASLVNPKKRGNVVVLHVVIPIVHLGPSPS